MVLSNKLITFFLIEALLIKLKRFKSPIYKRKEGVQTDTLFLGIVKYIVSYTTFTFTAFKPFLPS